jgi:hypothetical protein
MSGLRPGVKIKLRLGGEVLFSSMVAITNCQKIYIKNILALDHNYFLKFYHKRFIVLKNNDIA